MKLSRQAKLLLFVDGATAGTEFSGAAALARTKNGRFLGWLSEQLPRMTNNEAEYRAALLGLQLAKLLGAQRVQLISDSEVLVRQMRGLSRVNSPRLQPLHRALGLAVGQFASVQFVHVGRERNKVADALAADALQGWTVSMKRRVARWPWDKSLRG